MYYQYQNQPNYAQNYGAQTANNAVPTVKNAQYQYPTHTNQQNQYVVHPQYQTVQNVQQGQNIQTHQNNQVIYQQNPLQATQNVQYVKVAGQPNTYVQYKQPANYMQPTQQGQILKHQYNILTNAPPEGNQQAKPQFQNKTFNNQLPQNTIFQMGGQINFPQGPKTVLRATAPTISSNKKSNQAPQTELQVPHKENENWQRKSNHNNIQQQPINEIPINNTVNPTFGGENKQKVEPKFQGQNNNGSKKKTASFMTVHSLANLNYKAYPQAEFSSKPFFNISGYGANSYNGKIKSYNEDKIKIIYNKEKKFVSVSNNPNSPSKEYTTSISYFGIFDGHGGEKCSKFLKNYLDVILFEQTMFPNNVVESVRETFTKAENSFRQQAVQNNKLVDKSGSCAVISLIVNNMLYAINLGDSRALYSRDGGREYYQITRDHKPNDPKEQARIEKAGGHVYYANKTVINGVEVTLKEEQFGPGFKFPYRLAPSGLAVSFNKFLINFYIIFR